MRRAWPFVVAVWSAAAVITACWIGAGQTWRAFTRSSSWPTTIVLALGCSFVAFVLAYRLSGRRGSPRLSWADVIVAGIAIWIVASVAYFAAGGRVKLPH